MFKFSVISTNATYELVRSIESITEGNSPVTITLNTTGVQNGQLLPYTISGIGITSGDFVGSPSLTGDFVVQNNTASVVLSPMSDGLIEGPESFTLILNDNGVFVSTNIIDITDLTPDTFTFTARTGVSLNTVTTSNTVTITGITDPAFVSVSSSNGTGQVNINSAGWVTSGTINNGQTLQTRVTSSGSNGGSTSVTINVGGVSGTFTTTTTSLPFGYIEFSTRLFAEPGTLPPYSAVSSVSSYTPATADPAKTSITISTSDVNVWYNSDALGLYIHIPCTEARSDAVRTWLHSFVGVRTKQVESINTGYRIATLTITPSYSGGLWRSVAVLS